MTMTTDTRIDTQTFTRAAVEQRADSRNEPAWLRAMRLAAFDDFERLPWPTDRDRAWKYFDPRRLRLDGLTPFAGYDGAPAAAVRALTRAPETLAGLVVQQDAETAAVELADDLRRQGVIVESLDAALRDHEDLVRRSLLSRVVRPDESVFTALHTAFWSGGAFLYVPRDVTVVLPLHVAFVQQAADTALFPHLLVVLERGARLTLVEERIGGAGSGGFVGGVTELVLADEAELHHYAVQRWHPRTQDVTVQRALLGKDAKLTTLVAGLGGELQKWWVEARMDGAGSESTMLGVFFATGTQHMDVITLQDHIGPHTTSDLLYKAALKDRAVGAYYGLTRVGPQARGTAANQEDRNLLLSPRAKADADPVLEIMTSDVVRCGHGASAGPVDPEQLFYLETRGLPRPQAEKLLVQGFLHQVLDRIPLAPVAQTIERAIDEKLEAGA
jgi:Fe-S cluster assembly protein SufD